ncbi:hypothetical protein [Agrobacterium sp. OT33]|uniref:hypothetical protein n=1 Tax=Agrobacterium sp. OT33 TaxID=2815338 RepID=UPI001FEF7258|nr:hypothetical protein [Agrobacterium sp. OT33]
MAFVIKAEISNPDAETFAFAAQKTMYGGKTITEGDTVFLFASENEGGHGLLARGTVTSAQAVARKPGIARQTPRGRSHHKTNRNRPASAGSCGTARFPRLARRTARNRTQFQALPPGDRQGRRHL